MDIGTRVIQSSSVVHGLFWGKLIDNVESLVIVKSRIIEAYQINEEESSMYCVLEQCLNFDVHHSAMLTRETSHELVLATSGKVKIMAFSNDFFKTSQIFDFGEQNILKMEAYQNMLGVTVGLSEIHLYSDRELVRIIQDCTRIIDWHFVAADTILLLEYKTNNQEVFWNEFKIKSTDSRNITKFEPMFVPTGFIYSIGWVIAFGADRSVFKTRMSCLEVGSHRMLDGVYSSHCVFNNSLHVLTDDGILYILEDWFVQRAVLHTDSLVVSLMSSIFSTGHHGKSCFINREYAVSGESFRNGAIIDSVVMPLFSDIEYSSLVVASVLNNYSHIDLLSRTVCTYPIANIPKIAKYSTGAAVIDEILFLLPDLVAINSSTYEILKLPSLKLSSEKTLAISKLGSSLIQVTEHRIIYNEQAQYEFSDKALCAAISGSRICVGLICKTVEYFNEFQLVFAKTGTDFSTLHISDRIYIGMQNGTVNIYNEEGEEVETIKVDGVPHSYL